MLSMSFVFRSDKDETAFITPSTTISGSLDALIEREPRILIVVPAVGSPDILTISAPAIRPCSAWSTDRDGEETISFICTVPTDPVRSAFLVSPKPITTTSSRKLTSGFIVTSRTVFLPTIIFTVEYPINSYLRTDSADGTTILYCPFSSVTAPWPAAPSRMTAAPGRGC